MYISCDTNKWKLTKFYELYFNYKFLVKSEVDLLLEFISSEFFVKLLEIS